MDAHKTNVDQPHGQVLIEEVTLSGNLLVDQPPPFAWKGENDSSLAEIEAPTDNGSTISLEP
jgi:hypothetical protein